MGDALQNWLHLFFGSKDEVAVINDKVKCPSGGTISRARPKVDVGLMLMRRKFWKENWQNTSIQLGYLTTTFDSNPNSNSTQPTNLLISTPPLKQLQSTPNQAMMRRPWRRSWWWLKNTLSSWAPRIKHSVSLSQWVTAAAFNLKFNSFMDPRTPDPGPRCLCCCWPRLAPAETAFLQRHQCLEKQRLRAIERAQRAKQLTNSDSDSSSSDEEDLTEMSKDHLEKQLQSELAHEKFCINKRILPLISLGRGEVWFKSLKLD